MPEKTKNAGMEAAPVQNWVWILLFLLAIGAYFSGLWMPLVGPDEPRYAQVAREMFERGDPITPTLGGYHWFEKPALLYWLQIASYSAFGVGEFPARLGSALFGLGTSASLWCLGRFAIPDRHAGNQFARWLAVISASTLGLIVFAHGASFDIIVTFPLTASLVCFFIYDRSGNKNSRGSTLTLLLFYFFVGVSLLAKGLIGVVFPFAIIGLYHILSWKLPRRSLVISVLWGPLVTIAISSTWYWPMFARHGYEFVDEFFLRHHFQRFTSNKYQHPQPFYFFFWVMPLMTIPWLPFFGAAIVNQLKRLTGKYGNGSTRTASPLLNFAWAWLLVPLVFFSLSGSKLPGYILPAVPAAVIIISSYIFSLVSVSRWWQNIVLGTAGITFGVLILVAIFIAPGFASEESVKKLIETADARGHSSKHVLLYLRISHNAEFYAAGQLVRDKEGELLRISSKDELLRELSGLGGAALVMVPKEYISQLLDIKELETEVLESNDEFNIAAVTIRN